MKAGLTQVVDPKVVKATPATRNLGKRKPAEVNDDTGRPKKVAKIDLTKFTKTK
jgi:hypothetical protein